MQELPFQINKITTIPTEILDVCSEENLNTYLLCFFEDLQSDPTRFDSFSFIKSHRNYKEEIQQILNATNETHGSHYGKFVNLLDYLMSIAARAIYKNHFFGPVAKNIIEAVIAPYGITLSNLEPITGINNQNLDRATTCATENLIRLVPPFSQGETKIINPIETTQTNNQEGCKIM